MAKNLLWWALLLPPGVSAYSTGISPLNEGLSRLASYLSFSLEGIAFIFVVKILYFILIFAILNTAARKTIYREKEGLAKRTANIVSIVLALICALFIPDKLLLEISSIWAATIWLILLLGIPVLFTVLAFYPFEFAKRSWWHFLGALFILAALEIVSIFWSPERSLRIAENIGVFGQIMNVILSWVYTILCVLFVVKIMQAILAIGDDSGDTTGSSASQASSPVTQPPQPEEPSPDFSDQLDQIEKLLAAMAREFTEFKRACNDLLQTHYLAQRSGGYYFTPSAPVTPAQWRSVFDALSRMRDIAEKITAELAMITADASFKKITPKDNGRLIALGAKRSQQVTDSQKFYNDFMERYRNAQPPAP